MPYRLTGGPRGRPRKVKWVNATKTKPNLTPKQWKALKIEFPRLRDDIFVGGQSLHVKRPFPSSLLAGQVAKHVRVSRQMIQRWRNDPRYRDGIIYLFSQLICKRLDRWEQSATLEPILSSSHYGEMREKVPRERPSTGSMRSYDDGKYYTNPDEYVGHLYEPGYVFAENLPINPKKAYER